MTSPATGRLCPHDGSALTRTLGPPLTPPWLCSSCSRCWWGVQVRPANAVLWVPALQGYEPGEAADMLLLTAHVERDEALARARGRQ